MIDPFVNVAIRHQIYIEGLKKGRESELAKTVASLRKMIDQELGLVPYDNLGDLTKADLTIILGKLVNAASRIFDVWLNNTIEWLRDYIKVDCDFWQFGMSQLVQARAAPDKEEDRKPFVPLLPIFAASTALTVDAIYSKAKNTPMGANGILMEKFAEAYATMSGAQIGQEFVKAAANVETKAELSQALIGTKDANYTDGLLAKLNRQGNAVTDTVIQHVSGQTNGAVGKVALNRYLWVSVLDERTTEICLSRNGLVFVYGEGPMPPAHIKCRSSTIAFDGTGPVTMPTFTMWAGAQSQEFLNDAFDATVGERYTGSRAITLDEFAAKRSLILA